MEKDRIKEAYLAYVLNEGHPPQSVFKLTQQLGLAEAIEFELDVAGADALAERAQVAIYQIIRAALHQAIRRGPPTRVSIRVGEAEDGVETVVADDAPGERRRSRCHRARW